MASERKVERAPPPDADRVDEEDNEWEDWEPDAKDAMPAVPSLFRPSRLMTTADEVWAEARAASDGGFDVATVCAGRSFYARVRLVNHVRAMVQRLLPAGVEDAALSKVRTIARQLRV